MKWILLYIFLNKRINQIINIVLLSFIILSYVSIEIGLIQANNIIVYLYKGAFVLLLVKDILIFWYRSFVRKNQKMNDDSKKTSEELLNRVRREWENRFPELFNDWTHYQIKGDNIEIAVISGFNLIEGLDIVQENFWKYKQIDVSRAKLNANGSFVYDLHNNVILNYDNDKTQLDQLKEFLDNNS